MEGETVYGSQEDSQSVMSERVQTLARNIYTEFQRMIQNYDEDVVKDLMPHIVNMLEYLDLSYTANQEHEVELELLREDNEQLVTQYEREKQLRRTAESKLLELEDLTEEEHKALQTKVESLESLVRMLELKSKNSADHVFRLEEKENEMRKEFTKLHDRYTELLKVHMDHVERTRGLLGADRLEGAGLVSRQGAMNSWNLNVNLTPPTMGRSTGPLSFGFASLENANGQVSSKFFSNPVADVGNMSSPPVSHQPALQSELLDVQNTANLDQAKKKDPPSQRSVWSSPGKEGDDVLKKFDVVSSPGKSLKRKEERSNNTLYQELSFQESLLEDNSELTGNWVHPGEFASSGMLSWNIFPFKSRYISLRCSLSEFYRYKFSLVSLHLFSFIGCTFPPFFFLLVVFFLLLLPRKDSEPEIEDQIADGEKIRKVTDNFYGMGKEVENLIIENNELLATKNALNIVKDDLIAKVDELSSEQEILRDEIRSLQSMRSRLRSRTDELELEVKNLREEMENARKASKSEEEEDVPLSQRKRFTRVEMARVLMERNQYKERWMELQEAVRWTEMLRAQKAGQQDDTEQKKKQSVWKFFSNLFSVNERDDHPPTTLLRQSQTVPSLQFHVESGTLVPGNAARLGNEAVCRPRRKDNLLNERSEPHSVKAHVKRQDGRLQAYGWSLPSRQPATGASSPHSVQTTPTHSSSPTVKGPAAVGVPVPVYCRPLEDQEPGMKIWCAVGIDLTGGQTKDGGSMVGSSVFYNPASPPESDVASDPSSSSNPDAVQSLAAELAESLQEREDAEMWERRLSSLVWIISSATGKSRVNVIDSNRPGDVILTFDILGANVLCIASVSGVKDYDYPSPQDIIPEENEAAEPVLESSATESSATESGAAESSAAESGAADSIDDQIMGSIRYVSCSVAGSDLVEQPKDNETEVFQPTLSKRRISLVSGDAAVSQTEEVKNRTLRNNCNAPPWSDVIKDGLSEPGGAEFCGAPTALATVWMGCQCGRLFIHSAVLSWKKPLHVIKLPDAVLAIIHTRGRVLVALANGQVAIFCRRPAEGEWDFSCYFLLELAPPTVAVRCLTRVHSNVWAAFRNKIAVIDPETLRVQACFEAHPRKESQIRQLCWAGDGVWISIRLDSSIRLFHAHDYRHLQDVDVEPYVSKMLGTGKLGFSFVRITSMMISLQRLWMGTGNGVIISVPLSESSGSKSAAVKDILSALSHNQPAALNEEDDPSPPPALSAAVPVYSDLRDRVVAGSFIPYCSMAQAQLSFHGHKDAVKFFVAVPGQGGASAASSSSSDVVAMETNSANNLSSMLVLSGGEGYVDFRQGQEDEEYHGLSKGETSHIIVWQVHC